MYEILCSWVDVVICYVLLFGVMYLALRDFTMDPTKEQHQAKQSILHTIVAFYGDCMKTCKDFAPNFGNKGTGC
jgi:hypothetical protein